MKHEGTIETDLDFLTPSGAGHQARCSCGWCGPDNQTHDEAGRDLGEHYNDEEFQSTQGTRGQQDYGRLDHNSQRT